MVFLQLVVISWVTITVLRSYGKPGELPAFAMLRQLRAKHFITSIFLIVITALTAGFLMNFPILSWGWWQMLGGQGNIITGQVNSDNLLMKLLPLLLIALLIPKVANFAKREEDSFRRGAQNRTLAQNLKRALFFGLAHAVMGIPLGAALALSIPGMWFTYQYLKAYRKVEPTEQTNRIVEAKVTSSDGTVTILNPGDVVVNMNAVNEYRAEELAVESSTLYHAGWNILVFTVVLLAVAVAL